MDENTQQIQNIGRKVDSILQLLQGQDLDKEDKGMVGIQNDHERRLINLEKKYNNVRYFLYGITFPAAWGITDMLIKIFSKH